MEAGCHLIWLRKTILEISHLPEVCFVIAEYTGEALSIGGVSIKASFVLFIMEGPVHNDFIMGTKVVVGTRLLI